MKKIAVIGGGYAGIAVLYHLVTKAEQPSLKIVVIEKSDRLAAGIAYGTARAWHPLNVQAGQLGISTDDQTHFYQWLLNNESIWREADPTFKQLIYSEKSYLPRKLYGVYLKTLLEKALSLAKTKGISVEFIRAEVNGIDKLDSQLEIHTSHSQTLIANFVILAMGNPTTKRLPFENEKLLTHPHYTQNIWFKHPNAPFGSDDNQLMILGSGLTAVDAVLTLKSIGYPGIIHVVSKNGQFPHVHEEYEKENFNYLHPDDQLLKLFKIFKQKYRQQQSLKKNWRPLIDNLRPITTQLWHGLSLKSQKQFIRRLFPLWNQHRHRMSPESLQRLKRLIEEKRLILTAGMIKGIEIRPDNRLNVIYDGREMIVDFVLNCSGPEFILEKQRKENPLLDDLLKKKLVLPDSLGLGLRFNSLDSQVLSGQNEGTMFALGGLAFGERFETTAVPEIRSQAESIADSLLKRTKGPKGQKETSPCP